MTPETAFFNTLLGQNQTVIDNKIGDANYDIGHIFCTADSGIAPGLVGVSGQKAKGVTGQSNPENDPFDIDYVAHEIGHQLNADHTFNGTSCLPGARFGPTAVEPGSGSTILAYAGICNSDNLQSNSHDYFHSINVEQIIDYSSSGTGAVGTTAPTGNSIPTVDAGGDFSIPKLTPFKLTATGTDPDNDPLRYCWEQIDTGPAASLNAPDDGRIPLFRSFPPSPDRSRVFPQWSDILNGSTTAGEQLPSKARTMHFQVTGRDDRSGGGGVSSDTSEVDIIEAAGPFRVSAPATSVISSPLFEVKWDVSRTDQAPIGCSHVNILLSTDGGQTFTQTLANNTPNDGSELVALPPTANNNLRVLVESVGSIFFAVNPTNFTIRPADTRVFVVRHAEKESDSGDPELTVTGRARARTLADLMSRLEVTHIYSTNTRRTRQTAQPAATSSGGDLELYDDIDDLVLKIKALPQSSRVTVVGHSNTVGPIASALGVVEPIIIGNEFDNLIAIGLRENESPSLAKLKYHPQSIAPPLGGDSRNLRGQRRPAISKNTDSEEAGSKSPSSRPRAKRAGKDSAPDKDVMKRLKNVEERLERIEKMLR